MIKYRWLFILAALAMIFVPIQAACAQGADLPPDQVLIDRYAPALYFHPAEVFRPQSVDVLINTARLRQNQRRWFDINVLGELTIADLFGFNADDYALDVWYGDGGASDYKNYSAHRAYYREILSPEAGGPPVVAYAHVVRDEEPDTVTIQYWLFYYYNDWFNKHEGDWEMVEVILVGGEPRWVILSQHHGGARRAWEDTRVEDGTHPAAFVALGSHANYFVGDEVYPNVQAIGNVRLEVMDRTGSFGRLIPEVVLTPSREEAAANPEAWPGFEWLQYGGHWGEFAFQSDFGGPLGPADKGEQWETPFLWGLAQPLDPTIWYANRLRVAVLGPAAQDARVTLKDSLGQSVAEAEELRGMAILHRDPQPGQGFHATVAAPLSYTLAVTWPDREGEQVTVYTFENVPAGEVELSLGAGAPPTLLVGGTPPAREPDGAKTTSATWDAPDLVWLVGVLPADEVARGVLTSLLAAVIPALLYAGLLYWSDRYEKEPVRLLAAAFLWGAIPALVTAALVRVFFNLPPGMLSPQAFEMIRAGVVTPLVEELLKGGAVLYVAHRYRREFDNILDGIIYGGMVGFGYAMTANLISYLSAFMLRGFAGLGASILVEGVLYGMNHGMYTAIFGAGLGVARLAKDRRVSRLVPLGTFLLAALCNGWHNLVISRAPGLNPMTILITWAGALAVIAVMSVSLRRQRVVMSLELVDEVPNDLYAMLILPAGSGRYRWQGLRKAGLSGWRQARRAAQLAAELAFKKQQAKRFPEETGLADEVARLRQELRQAIDGEAYNKR